MVNSPFYSVGQGSSEILARIPHHPCQTPPCWIWVDWQSYMILRFKSAASALQIRCGTMNFNFLPVLKLTFLPSFIPKFCRLLSLKMASVSVAIRLSLLFFLPFAIASCYNPDGGLILDPAYQPCVQIVGSVSMCCATNRTADADVCLPNGLCHNPCSATGICGGSENGQYWRETCTDSSWNSPYCLKGVCTNASVSRR